MRLKVLLILGSIICLLIFPLAVFFAGISVMASDGGITPEARMIFYVMCGWPVSALGGPIGAALTQRRIGAWALLWFVPCLAYAVAIFGLDVFAR
ncbi:hypothetical protein [Phyllobacterium myrsinacearum]|uniref:Uncharacterized protein n=1 Tax=Phyllobacterium myrsinacearum TaxID=28101 RepID=A0A839ENK0_9HYPH|nr:hypothetical protein [Phyllobacterium myrsinacearum]MBA8880449.1 hypothetical protein [Phyllobacterium myrsinacearum]